jgi:hypothetical protein
MSVKIMRMVWDLEMDQKDKLVLLAYADCADHDGGSIHPAVVTIAKRTGYSERSIQRHTRLLEKHGWLISDGYGVGQGNTNRWHMKLMDGVQVSPFAEINADTHISFLETEKETPLAQERVTPVAQERVTPVQEKVTAVTEKVTPMTLKGDTAVSSEPSLTVIKPSANARAFAAQKIKMLPQKAQRGETAELQRARSPNVWLSDHEPGLPIGEGLVVGLGEPFVFFSIRGTNTSRGGLTSAFATGAGKPPSSGRRHEPPNPHFLSLIPDP